ncbi:hypothetical protein D9M69_611890 [compost metagenome]
MVLSPGTEGAGTTAERSPDRHSVDVPALPAQCPGAPPGQEPLRKTPSRQAAGTGSRSRGAGRAAGHPRRVGAPWGTLPPQDRQHPPRHHPLRIPLRTPWRLRDARCPLRCARAEGRRLANHEDRAGHPTHVHGSLLPLRGQRDRLRRGDRRRAGNPDRPGGHDPGAALEQLQ